MDVSISRPLIFDDFWAVTDQKMAQPGSKIEKCESILNVNRLPGKKFEISAPKAKKPRKLVKSLVKTDLHAQPTLGSDEIKTQMSHLILHLKTDKSYQTCLLSYISFFIYVICTPEPLYPCTTRPLDPFLGFYKAHIFKLSLSIPKGCRFQKSE
jgi:hypothetical protein